MSKFFSNTKKFFTRNFTLGSKQSKNQKNVCVSTPITLLSVNRQRNMTDEERRRYATEQLDTYYGFSLPYLRWLIDNQINNRTIAIEMKRLAVALPLLKRFINGLSRVYAQNPTRSFFLGDKQIVSKVPSDISDESKFIVNEKLSKILESFYSKDVVSCIKESEKLTNLLKTTIYKVITNDDGQIRIKFIPNDTIQICQDPVDPNLMNDIAFIRDDFSNDRTFLRNTRVLERWTMDNKSVPVDKNGKVTDQEAKSTNKASQEAEKLFGTKRIGSGFAPFVVLRESDPANTFWNLKDTDTFDYIKNININLTELRYLIRYASFGLKWVINATMDKDSTTDPTGFLSFQSAGRVPGDAKNIQVGEFKNEGRIKEVIEAIIFNLKMLYDAHNLTLDSLISSNSIRSAENKDKDNEELFANINSQRDIWAVNEENQFKVMQAVYNRDNVEQIPKGVTLRVNFEEHETQEKTNEDWMVEIENNISSVFDWISAENPDLNTNEIKRLFDNNVIINSAKAVDKNEFEDGNDDEQDDSNQTEDKDDRNN